MTKPADQNWLDPSNWVTPKELAASLRKSVKTIYNLMSVGGDLPPIYRPGGHAPRFFRPEVEAWILSGRQTPPVAYIERQGDSERSP